MLFSFVKRMFDTNPLIRDREKTGRKVKSNKEVQVYLSLFQLVRCSSLFGCRR